MTYQGFAMLIKYSLSWYYIACLNVKNFLENKFLFQYQWLSPIYEIRISLENGVQPNFNLPFMYAIFQLCNILHTTAWPWINALYAHTSYSIHPFFKAHIKIHVLCLHIQIYTCTFIQMDLMFTKAVCFNIHVPLMKQPFLNIILISKNKLISGMTLDVILKSISISSPFNKLYLHTCITKDVTVEFHPSISAISLTPTMDKEWPLGI